MSPRPRKATDAEIFAATQRVMTRTGPRDLSLAQIAEEAGVTAGALVQRFGSKRELLLAVMEEWAAGTAGMMHAMRGRRGALAAVHYYAECMAAMGGSPAALANHLAYLQMDLTDDDYRACMAQSGSATRDALESWIHEAVTDGDLIPETNARQLAEQVEITISGSLLAWAVYQEGTAVSFVRRQLDRLLQPYLTTAKRTSRRSRKK
jgi:AcrR family transcriptional regulator